MSNLGITPLLDYNHQGKPIKKELSKREKEILYWIGLGKFDTEIGNILFLSPKTVETHRSNIYKKMNFHSRYEAMLYAIREGITPCPCKGCLFSYSKH